MIPHRSTSVDARSALGDSIRQVRQVQPARSEGCLASTVRREATNSASEIPKKSPKNRKMPLIVRRFLHLGTAQAAISVTFDTLRHLEAQRLDTFNTMIR